MFTTYCCRNHPSLWYRNAAASRGVQVGQVAVTRFYCQEATQTPAVGDIADGANNGSWLIAGLML